MENLKIVLISIVLFIIIYLFGSFYSATLDISKWDDSVRFAVVLFSAFACFINLVLTKIKL